MKPEKTAAPGFLYFHVTSTFTIHVKYSKMSSSVQPPQEPNQPRILTERSSSTLHHNKSFRQATGAKGTEGHCRSEYQHQHQSQNKLRLPDGPGVDRPRSGQAPPAMYIWQFVYQTSPVRLKEALKAKPLQTLAAAPVT